MQRPRPIYRRWQCNALLALLFLGCQSVDRAGEAQEERARSILSRSAGGGLRGLYLPVTRSRNLAYVKRLDARASDYGVNQYVLDLQGYQGLRALIDPEVVQFLRSRGRRVVARMVCFEGGLRELPPAERHMQALRTMMRQSAQAGFQEIQLDYIRFSDGRLPYSAVVRQKFLDELLGQLRAEADGLGLSLSADVFGRVAFNRHDHIGQDLEAFGKHLHRIYPMLYPSHFYGQRARLSNPYGAVRDGLSSAHRRLAPLGVESAAYIQVFSIGLGYANMTLPQYVAAQVRGAEDTQALGWIAWNPNGVYEDLFRGLNLLAAEREASGSREDRPDADDDEEKTGNQLNCCRADQAGNSIASQHANARGQRQR